MMKGRNFQMLECGCKIYARLNHPFGPELSIEYCPMHAAAPEMYEALKRCRRGYLNLEEMGYLSDSSKEVAEIDVVLTLADKGR